ncbi:4-dihydrotrisporin dehydrogenase [Dacryopinax primogenitus]|uniref:4-dihydrotrisporin dehydrogenase n=1 Tax=Dacryopinax primogenitus (strain DJM 731) TaxID=1858805 RepID=M5GFE9_DACPD|nr:4-dihydrotrisporin dehydrogenase [Dacryopinax primogenitus]EJU06212.1 4-dihydrotrisporin dehydrogenase [Dacryopinax primogenitus]
MSDRRIFVVTGTSRGLGLEFVKQLASEPETTVICVVRTLRNTDQLAHFSNDKDNVFIVEADISKQTAVKQVVDEIDQMTDGKVDVLINNAAVNTDPARPLHQCSKAFNDHLFTNVTGSIIMTNAMLPMLRKGKEKRIINISSGMGSLAYNEPGSEPTSSFSAFSVSKAGLNMATRKYASEWGKEGFVAVSLSPGWVQTRQGGSAAPLTPTDSVSAMLKVVNGLTPEQNGAFINYDGTEIDF